MLVQLPYSKDWIHPELVVALRLCVSAEAERPYQVQVLSVNGGETILFSTATFRTSYEAEHARDVIALHLNSQRLLLKQESNQLNEPIVLH